MGVLSTSLSAFGAIPCCDSCSSSGSGGHHYKKPKEEEDVKSSREECLLCPTCANAYKDDEIICHPCKQCYLRPPFAKLVTSSCTTCTPQHCRPRVQRCKQHCGQMS